MRGCACYREEPPDDKDVPNRERLMRVTDLLADHSAMRFRSSGSAAMRATCYHYGLSVAELRGKPEEYRRDRFLVLDHQ